jgi:hypothetical protein
MISAAKNPQNSKLYPLTLTSTQNSKNTNKVNDATDNNKYRQGDLINNVRGPSASVLLQRAGNTTMKKMVDVEGDKVHSQPFEMSSVNMEAPRDISHMQRINLQDFGF